MNRLKGLKLLCMSFDGGLVCLKRLTGHTRAGFSPVQVQHESCCEHTRSDLKGLTARMAGSLQSLQLQAEVVTRINKFFPEVVSADMCSVKASNLSATQALACLES